MSVVEAGRSVSCGEPFGALTFSITSGGVSAVKAGGLVPGGEPIGVDGLLWAFPESKV